MTHLATPGAATDPGHPPTLQPIADTLLVANALRGSNADLYHAIEFGQPVRSRLPVVVTVHDLIPFVMPRDYPWVRRARVLGLRLLRRADAVIAVSEATRRDVLRFSKTDPERITVIPEGVSPGLPTRLAPRRSSAFVTSCGWTGRSCSPSAPSILASASRCSPTWSAASGATTTSSW